VKTVIGYHACSLSLVAKTGAIKMMSDEKQLIEKMHRILDATEDLPADDQLRGLIEKGIIDDRGNMIVDQMSASSSNGHVNGNNGKQ
jgi:hypothetical protein